MSLSPQIQRLVQALIADQAPHTPAPPNYFPQNATPKTQENGGISSPSFPSKPGVPGGAAPNTAGSVATDSGAWGNSASPYAFADYSGAYGGLGDTAATDAGSWGAGAASGTGDAAASSASGAGSSGFGGMGAFALPLAYAAAIGIGKNTEANHPNTIGGDASLGLLGPSGAQIIKDPIGMGLPTLLGAPFLTPLTGSDDAKRAKPEFSGLFGLGF